MRIRSFAASAALTGICALATSQAAMAAVVPLQPLTPAPAPQAAATDDESTQLWFVELANAPVADGGSIATTQADKKAFRAAARSAGIVLQERYAYDTLFNGLSVAVDKNQVSALSRLPGVKNIYMVGKISLPAPEESTPDLASAVQMTGADIVQNELGLDGSGVKVAVMDTGIDIDHPDFGGNGSNHSTSFPTARVITGYDFVGDAFNGSNTPVPDAIPDDCAGHGSHVAGIIGANGGVKGVAPGVKFGAYRVFGCSGSTTDDVMIAAMERALADHMQVLNMSIGSAFEWPDAPTAKAATRLVNKGMVVVASIGNSGASGLFSAGAPGLGEKVIGVASFNNTRVTQRAFSISPDGQLVGFNPASGGTLTPTSGTSPMARTGTTTTTNDACSALAPGSLSGKIALIRRGTCGFYAKSRNAQAAGAIGVVLYNNASGQLNANASGSPALSIPVVGITAANGAVINSRLAAGSVDLTWGTGTVSTADPNGGLISSFSSYGLSPDLVVKPDIGAPGGNIYSTYPIELGSYATLSGTSMSSPHVAGAAALLLQAAPQTPSQAVRTIMQNTAVPKPWWGNPGLGYLDNVHRQGAGMLRIDNAILATTRIEPSRLSLGEGQAGPVTSNVTLKNNGVSAVTYAVSAVNALSTDDNINAPGFDTSDATVAFNTASVTVAAGSSATVTATITPALAPVGGQYGGYLVFTPTDGGITLRVPYAGYIGDYQARQVMTPTPYGFPWLAKATTLYVNQPSGATYTMAGSDIPHFLVHLDVQSRKFRMDVTEVGTGKDMHRAYQQDYLPRNGTATGFFAFTWDGLTTAGNKTYVVPNGKYIVTISVLKPLGDDANPAHWERWTSPVVTIARP